MIVDQKTRRRSKSTFQVGDPVIYHKRKRSPSPGPRAEEVRPTQHGEDYHYAVDKFWTVKSVRNAEQTLELVTRRGKVHRVGIDDPNLRRPNLIEKWVHRDDFPQREDEEGGGA